MSINNKILLKLNVGGGTKVFIDDTEIHGVVDVKFTQSVDSMPTATITVISKGIEVDTEGLAEIIKREEITK